MQQDNCSTKPDDHPGARKELFEASPAALLILAKSLLWQAIHGVGISLETPGVKEILGIQGEQGNA